MTQSLEDYLESVSFLAEEHEGLVRITDIAERLKVSKPSVVNAMRSLEEQGFVVYKHYGTITLTKSGKTRAALIRDRHLVLTRFISDFLGVPLGIAEADACKIEHVLSEETLKQLKHYIAKHASIAHTSKAGNQNKHTEPT